MARALRAGCLYPEQETRAKCDDETCLEFRVVGTPGWPHPKEISSLVGDLMVHIGRDLLEGLLSPKLRPAAVSEVRQ